MGATIFASSETVEKSRAFVFNHFLTYLSIIYIVKVLFNTFSVDKQLLLIPLKKSQIINLALVKSFIASILVIINFNL